MFRHIEQCIDTAIIVPREVARTRWRAAAVGSGGEELSDVCGRLVGTRVEHEVPAVHHVRLGVREIGSS